jgi:hypothetical protein
MTTTVNAPGRGVIGALPGREFPSPMASNRRDVTAWATNRDEVVGYCLRDVTVEAISAS